MYTTAEQAAFEFAVNTAGEQLVRAAKELQRNKNQLSEDVYKRKLQFINDMVMVVRTANNMAQAFASQQKGYQREINRLKNDLPEPQEVRRGYLSHLRHDKELFREADINIQQKRWGF